VPEQPTKLPPRATVAGLDGNVKPAGNVIVTVSPEEIAPPADAAKLTVQLALACAVTLEAVKVTAVTEPPVPPMAVVAVAAVVFSEVATE
jgi:hypothetical protein